MHYIIGLNDLSIKQLLKIKIGSIVTSLKKRKKSSTDI